ncbi:hypothetical protein SAMN05428971_0248 [Candidatus Pantoea varia]|uniref:Uncharacterized protein n=1 Tax=Candidatus Pantoea varia TaxID=1881036 RepID=A0A1I4WMG9_9GAMM|nr:hypothetical protein SAMN05428971_0248 [Pantoea varia]
MTRLNPNRLARMISYVNDLWRYYALHIASFAAKKFIYSPADTPKASCHRPDENDG